MCYRPPALPARADNPLPISTFRKLSWVQVTPSSSGSPSLFEVLTRPSGPDLFYIWSHLFLAMSPVCVTKMISISQIKKCAYKNVNWQAIGHLLLVSGSTFKTWVLSPSQFPDWWKLQDSTWRILFLASCFLATGSISFSQPVSGMMLRVGIFAAHQEKQVSQKPISPRFHV